MVDVLYSLVNVTQRFDQLIFDPLYIRNLDMTSMTMKSFYDRIYSIDNQVLSRICKNILPRIHHQVHKLIVEQHSMERVLHTINYPQLYSLSLIDFQEEVLRQYLTDNTTLRKLLTEQITCLKIDAKDTATSPPLPETLSTMFALVLSLCKRLIKLNFCQFYHRSTLCTFELSTNCKSSTLTALKINVKTFDDCLYLLDGRLNRLSTLIIHVKEIARTQGTIDNTMSSDSVAVNENDTTPIINRPRDNFIQPPPLHARLLCELLGTCFFVFFGAGCATKGPGLLAASTAHGLATIWLVYVFGPVSGGHFNAGPTIAFAIDGNMKVLEILGYLLAQAIGGLLAGALLLALYGTGTTLGTPMLSPGVNVAQGFAIEFICTTVLSFVIKFTTTYHTHKEAAFPIGLVVFSSFLVGADRDGAALNPWRWLGPAVASNTFRSEAWIYFVGPICGFICGYGLFRLYKLFWNASIYRPI